MSLHIGNNGNEKCNVHSDFIDEPTVIRVNENNIAEYNHSNNIDSKINSRKLKEGPLYNHSFELSLHLTTHYFNIYCHYPCELRILGKILRKP